VRLESAQRRRSERHDGYLVLDAVGHADAFGVGVGEADDELVRAFGDGYATWPEGAGFGSMAGGDSRGEGNPVDKIVVFEGAFGIVLDRDDVWF
jgi:hypothetical protein